jgi:uncharacterized protein YlxW (UPF0749 family)
MPEEREEEKPVETPAEEPVDVAEPADDGPPDGRDRLRGAFWRPNRTQLIVAVLLAVVGFAAVVQIRDQQTEDDYSGLRQQDLIDILDGLSGTAQRTQREIDELERTRTDLLTESRQRQAAIDQAQEQADALDVLAGTVPVTGPGIRLTITEVDGTVSLGSMLDTVQELRTAEAEAMQINGKVRVVAQTSFEQTDGGMVVDGVLVKPPYVVDVIGVPDTLAGAVEFGLGPRKQLEDDGAEIDVELLASLDIESVREPEQPEFSSPG